MHFYCVIQFLLVSLSHVKFATPIATLACRCQKMKFTDKSIQALKSKSERYEIWDDGKNGFGVRVTPRGIKSFIWLYRFEGKSKRLTLGTYPKLSLFDAGKALAEARAKLSQGTDPSTELVQSRKDYRNSILIADLANEYLERHAKPNKRSAREDERILCKDIVPRWGRKKAKDITKHDVLSLLDDILERGAPIAANRTLACIRKMFNWSIERDILAVNPCLYVKSPSRENRRDRVLSPEEIILFWNNLPRAAMSPLIVIALKFQLVSAQRKAEIISAKWSDFDFNAKIWTIPAERSKNRTAHRVPLSNLAYDILMELRNFSSASIYLFPSQKLEKTIQGSSIDHALRNNRETLGIENVTPHDLRRTAASLMASLGINRLAISKILNHVEQSVTSIYDRYSYDNEKREALEMWGKYLTNLTNGITNEKK